MRDVSFEQLVILAIFLLVGLVNFVADLLRKRGRTAHPRERDHDLAIDQDLAIEEELDLDEAVWREPTGELPPDLDPTSVPVPAPPRVSARQRAAPSVVPRMSPPPLPARSVQGRHRRRRLHPREARRGVVLMAILGPCRGIDPHAGNPT